MRTERARRSEKIFVCPFFGDFEIMSDNRIKKIILCFFLIFFLPLAGSGTGINVYADDTTQSGSSGYTEEQKAAAKAWLSAHGYAPTRVGAYQAYADYLNGKFDNDPEVMAAVGRTTRGTSAVISTEAESAGTEGENGTDTVGTNENPSTGVKQSENKTTEEKKENSPPGALATASDGESLDPADFLTVLSETDEETASDAEALITPGDAVQDDGKAAEAEKRNKQVFLAICIFAGLLILTAAVVCILQTGKIKNKKNGEKS